MPAVYLFACGDSNGAADTTSPSTPADLTVTVVSSGQTDIAWTASTDNVGVTGYKIYRDGTVIGTSATTSYSDTNLNASTQYCYAVSAYDAADNESGQSTEKCVTTLGAGVGSKFPIATTVNHEMSGGIAFDGTNYLVGINGDASSANGVGAQLVSQTGTLVGSLISTGRSGSAPFIAFDGTNYLLVWADDATIPSDLYGMFIDPSGSPGTPFLIATGIEARIGPAVAYGNGQYLVCYYKVENPAIPDSRKVYGRIVSTSGIVDTEISISTGFGYFGYNNVAFDGTNFLVVWTETAGASSNYEVKGQFISSTGELVGTEFSINASTYLSDNPLTLAFDGTNYLVVWMDEVGSGEWDIFGQLVDKSGNHIGNVIPVITAPGHQGLQPSIAFDGTNYLVTWIDTSSEISNWFVCDADEGTCWDIYGQYISTAGNLVGSELTINTDPGNQMAMVFFGGAKYLVEIVDGVSVAPSGCTEGCYAVGDDVYGQFITP
ncbi:MAG: fibronectin type III domain-containing protein [Nitrospirota bacterium]|nr:fibronectin type III domain-containing protein [Nitrospirota bacterium]